MGKILIGLGLVITSVSIGISRYAFTGIYEGGKAKINLEIMGGEGSRYRVSDLKDLLTLIRSIQLMLVIFSLFILQNRSVAKMTLILAC
jgi:hypothetical protein